jgi:hypothetical protein
MFGEVVLPIDFVEDPLDLQGVVALNVLKVSRDAIALVVGPDEQHIGCALRWHDSRRPPGRGIFRVFLKLLSVDCGCSAG